MISNKSFSPFNLICSSDYTEVRTDRENFKYLPLNREVYFRPSNFPYISRFDTRIGSCFENYIVPTPSFKFHEGTVLELSKRLRLSDYREFLIKEIEQSILNIYNTDEVVFLYSGGIDSITVLSFLIKLKLLGKTRIVSILDSIQTSASALVNNKDNQKKIVELKTILGNSVKSFDIVELNDQTIVDVFNSGNYYNLVCHASSTVMSQMNCNTFLNGGHGNQSLLHQRCNLHEVLKIHPTKIKDIDTETNFYCKKFNDVTLDEELIGVEFKELICKPWHKIYVNQKQLHTPLGSEKIFYKLRQLNFSDVEVRYLQDAKFAREIINLNCDTFLDDFITNESMTDADNIPSCKIPTSNINKSLLTIPENLNHNKEGLDFLQWEVSRITKHEDIELNSLVSIKLIQNLVKEFK